jgi:hypothetical protein
MVYRRFGFLDYCFSRIFGKCQRSSTDLFTKVLSRKETALNSRYLQVLAPITFLSLRL